MFWACVALVIHSGVSTSSNSALIRTVGGPFRCLGRKQKKQTDSSNASNRRIQTGATLMAGRSMFENCLAADVLSSLRGRAGSWSEDDAGQRLARLSIKVDSSNRANRGGSSSDEYWISGDHMSGSLSVESVPPIKITRARISLEGRCALPPKQFGPQW